MPSWLEELVVSTCVPSCKVPTEQLTTMVGSEVVAYFVSVGQQRSWGHTIEEKIINGRGWGGACPRGSSRLRIGTGDQSQPC